MIAPTERSMSVTVIPSRHVSLRVITLAGAHTQETSEYDTPNDSEISVIVRDTVKKSNESHVHPRKPAANMSHWCEVSSRRMAIGFRNLF